MSPRRPRRLRSIDFDPTPEQKAIREVARAFTEAEIVPVASAHDRDASFPGDVINSARDLGLVDVTIPSELGGGGLGVLEAVIVSEQIARGCSGIASALTLNSVTADAVLVAGSADQQATYLGRITEGGFGCYALTEPGAGSDVGAIRARAEQRGDTYVLNGSKVWITNATVASFYVVFAKTTAGGRDSISAFLVERDAPGVSVSEKLGKLGQRAAPAAEVFFEDVEVGADALLGEEGSGFGTAMCVFDRSRPVIAAFAVGILERCLEESVAHATTRQTMGKPIIRHQAIGHKIADMAIRLEAARALTYKAAWLLDQGRPNTLEAAYAKAFAADSAMWAAVEAVQIFGGMGYSDEFPVEKLMRDAKVVQIYEGTSEIQRNIIARELASGASRARA